MSLRRRVVALGFPGCQNMEIRVEKIVESTTGLTFDRASCACRYNKSLCLIIFSLEIHIYIFGRKGECCGGDWKIRSV